MTTTPRTWVVGEVVTAALLNTEIRDQFNSMFTWTSYSPAWSGTGTAIGNGTLNGRYWLVGKTCTAQVEMVFGTTSNVGTGVYSWSMPFTAANPGSTSANYVYCGSARGHAANWYAGTAAVFKNTTSAKIYNNAPSPATEWAPTVPVTWAAATTNYIHFTVTYETA